MIMIIIIMMMIKSIMMIIVMIIIIIIIIIIINENESPYVVSINLKRRSSREDALLVLTRTLTCRTTL